MSACKLLAKELYAGFIELMGFVENHRADAGQQFGHARFPHRQVGKEQMVIDDHHISCKRLTTCMVDVTIPESWALATQTVLTGRSDNWKNRRTFIQPSQFG